MILIPCVLSHLPSSSKRYCKKNANNRFHSQLSRKTKIALTTNKTSALFTVYVVDKLKLLFIFIAKSCMQRMFLVGMVSFVFISVVQALRVWLIPNLIKALLFLAASLMDITSGLCPPGEHNGFIPDSICQLYSVLPKVSIIHWEKRILHHLCMKVTLVPICNM